MGEEPVKSLDSDDEQPTTTTTRPQRPQKPQDDEKEKEADKESVPEKTLPPLSECKVDFTSVESWLKSIHLGHLYDKFVEEDYEDVDMIKNFTLQDLTMMLKTLDIAENEKKRVRDNLVAMIMPKLSDLSDCNPDYTSTENWLNSIEMGHLFDKFVEEGHEDMEVIKKFTPKDITQMLKSLDISDEESERVQNSLALRAKSAVSRLEVGDRVILQNLKKNPSLNGLKGTILKARAKNKFDIKLDNGDGRNNISSKYLKKGRPRISKKSSYYFFKSTDAEEAKKYQPKKLSKSKVKKVQKNDLKKKKGLSAWNKGGTWEDRDLKDWSHKKLRSLFSNLKVETEASEADIMMDLTDISGDASVVYARGKPRIGFDLVLKGTVTGEYCNKEVNAKFEITEMDENAFRDSDYEFEITSVPSVIKKKLLKACRPAAHKAFETFVEEMQKESEG